MIATIKTISTIFKFRSSLPHRGGTTAPQGYSVNRGLGYAARSALRPLPREPYSRRPVDTRQGAGIDGVLFHYAAQPSCSSESRGSTGHRAVTGSRPMCSQLLVRVAYRIHILPLIRADRAPVKPRGGGQAAEPTVDPTPPDRGLLPLNGNLMPTAELPNRTSSPPRGSDVSSICEGHEAPCHSEPGRMPIRVRVRGLGWLAVARASRAAPRSAAAC